jgi:integrase
MSGNNAGRKRRFGSLRVLPSGKWQARYTGPDGLPRKAPTQFSTKKAAERFLVETEAQMLRGDWFDPAAGRISLHTYAQTWIRERELKPRTREEYERHLRLHVEPFIGPVDLADITPAVIRTWRAERLQVGVGPSTIAKTYRILHAIFATATDDEVIRRNPCRIKKAGQDTAAERPTAQLAQVLAIAAAIQPRYRLMVLLAAFAQLRFGELVALRRSSIDLEAMELRVQLATAEMEDGRQVDDGPKSEAGKRLISLPYGLRIAIEQHLASFAQPGPAGRLFVGPEGGIPRRRNFNRVWKRAMERAGLPEGIDLHLHDLRHTGSTWSAQSGATLKEVMARIGHSSPRAAMIYQHASRERDRVIASSLDALIEAATDDSRTSSTLDLAWIWHAARSP